MAVRSSGDAAHYFYDNVGVVDHRNPFTWMAWVSRKGSTAPSQALVWAITDSGFLSYMSFYYDTDGSTLRADTHLGTFGSSYSTSVDTPFHLCVSRTSTTSLIWYVDGVAQGSAMTTDVTGAAAPTDEYLLSLTTGYASNQQVWAEKVWDTGLSADEIAIEMASIAPRTKLASLRRFTPMIATTIAGCAISYSKNSAFTWDYGGTPPSVEDAPKGVPWG